MIIRRNTFLGGIVLGALAGFLFDHSLRWTIVGAFMGGNFLGMVGEGIVTRETGDVAGAGCVLGFLATLSYIVFRAEYSLLHLVRCAALWASFPTLGRIGHMLGGMLSSSRGAGTRRDTLWLLSHSTGAGDLMLARLAPALPGEQITCIRTAWSGRQCPGNADPERVAKDPRLVAVVVAIEPDGLDDPSYTRWIEWAIKTVAVREDFRLFMMLHQVTRADMMAAAKRQGDSIQAQLVETVQFAPDDIEDPAAAVGGFVARLDEIRDAARRRRLRLRMTTLAGAGAAALQAVSLLAIIALVLGSAAGGWVDPLHWAAANSLLAGIALWPLATCWLGVMAAARNRSGPEPADEPFRLVLARITWPAACLVGAGGLLYWLGAADVRWPWVALGACGGVMLDSARRHGHHARLALQAIHPSQATRSNATLPPTVLRAIAGAPPSPLVARLMSPRGASVFISYRHSGEWSGRQARRLYEALRAADIDCFLDQVSIGEGACWRKTLNRRLADSNVLLSIVEASSLVSDWTAIEVEVALRRAGTYGVPEVFVLVHPSLEGAGGDGCYPVFPAVLARRLAATGPRVLPLDEAAIALVVRSLEPARFRASRSLIPPWLEEPLSLAADAALALLILVGSQGTLVGFGAPVVLALELAGVIDASSVLGRNGLLPAACLLSAYWAGSVARLVVSTRFDLSLDETTRARRRQSRLQLFMVVAFVGLAIRFGLALDALWAGWGLVVAGMGWIAGHRFVGVISSMRPHLGRGKEP